MSSTELLIVGGGPAGYVAALRAAGLGVGVTLVEREGVGGTCLNRGCIPSKALIHAADVADTARTGDNIGIEADVKVDFEKVGRWKDRVIRRLTTGVEKLCEAKGVKMIEGTATFEDPHHVSVATDEAEISINFEYAVVATGSRPLSLPGFDYTDSPVLDAAALLDREVLPERLAVVGAGYIGMELSIAFAKLGTDVTIIEFEDSLLPVYPNDLTRPIERTISDLSIETRLGQTASGWEHGPDGIEVYTEPASDKDEVGAVPADAVLIAVGREPVADTLNLDAADIECDEAGYIETNDLRTSQDHIFAVGDVSGAPLLAHAGSQEGKLAAERVAGIKRSTLDVVPEVVFTDPEIARVGLSESGARQAGYDPAVGQFRFRANGRALTTGDATGFARVVGDAETGAVLGAGVVGPKASELIAEVSLAVGNNLTLADLAETIHAHPTLSEATMEAAADALDEGIHSL